MEVFKHIVVNNFSEHQIKNVNAGPLSIMKAI